MLNKKSVIGIIIAIAIVIGAISLASYSNLSTTANNNDVITPPAPLNTTGRHLTLELNEDVGIAQSP